MPINVKDVLPAFDREQRIEIEFPGVPKEVLRGADGAPKLVRFRRVRPERSFITYQRLRPEEMDAAIAAQSADAEALELDLDWKVYAHDEPPGVEAALTAHGWIPEEPDAVMALDLPAAPATLRAPLANEVRAITTRAGLDEVIRVMEQVWGGSFAWITRRLGDHLEVPGYLEVYVAYAEGEPACAGWVYFAPGSQFASLWGGSTVERLRGRGLYTDVLRARVQSALRRGRRYLTIDAGAMSRPIVARHGFELLTTATSFEWRAA